MATIRNIYFQEDVEIELKKEQNISGLINNLLRKHYQETNHKTMTYEQKLQRIKELELKLEFEKKMELLKNEAGN